jgi:hypothetical protein
VSGPGRDGLTLVDTYPPAAGLVGDARVTELVTVRTGEACGPGAGTAKAAGVALVRVVASPTAPEPARAAPAPAVLRNGADTAEADGAETA